MVALSRIRPELVPSYNKAIYEEAVNYLNSEPKLDERIKAFVKAQAEGAVDTIEQSRINYITYEVLATNWAITLFRVRRVGAGTLPVYKTRSRKKYPVYTVTTWNGTPQIASITEEGHAVGSWVTYQTPRVSYLKFDPLFPQAALQDQDDANREIVYQLDKKLETTAKTLLDNAIGTFPAGTFSYVDSDVQNLPTSNLIDPATKPGAINEQVLQEIALHFNRLGLALPNSGETITVHMNVLDQEYLWDLAPLTSNLGGYSYIQEQIHRAGVFNLTLWGVNFRFAVQNTLPRNAVYATVDRPIGDLFIMDDPNFPRVMQIQTNDPRKGAMVGFLYASFLQPAPWRPHVMKYIFRV